MSKGSVRLAQREDTPALVALMTEFYAEAGFALSDDEARRAFTILLNDPLLGHAWLIEEEAEGVGYVVLTFAFSMEFGGFRG